MHFNFHKAKIQEEFMYSLYTNFFCRKIILLWWAGVWYRGISQPC